MTTSTPTSFQLGRTGILAGALFCLVSQTANTVQADLAGDGAVAATLAGPARVVDGDTLDVAGQRIRLEGIDAPEAAQTCQRADGSPWPCGREAIRALTRHVAGQDVVCAERGTDKYRRILAVCHAGGRELNAAMVSSGMAWAFVKYSELYVREEHEARQALAGIWQGRSEPAWVFREKGWTSAEVAAPQGCAIKGNVSSKGHIYHMPWSRWYDRVTVDPRRGERWFCSEDEAIAAGWRPALAL